MRKNRTLLAQAQGVLGVDTICPAIGAAGNLVSDRRQMAAVLSPADRVVTRRAGTNVTLAALFWAGIETICQLEDIEINEFLALARRQHPGCRSNVAAQLAMANYFAQACEGYATERQQPQSTKTFRVVAPNTTAACIDALSSGLDFCIPNTLARRSKLPTTQRRAV